MKQNSPPQKFIGNDQPINELLAHALNFIEEVKARFVNEPQRYAKFSEEIIKTVKDIVLKAEEGSGSSSTYRLEVDGGFVERIKAILEGHEDLILRLGTFLPMPFKRHEDNGVGKSNEKVATQLKNKGKEVMVESPKRDANVGDQTRLVMDWRSKLKNKGKEVMDWRLDVASSSNQVVSLMNEDCVCGDVMEDVDELDKEGRVYYEFFIKVSEKMAEMKCFRFIKDFHNYSLGLISKRQLGILVESEIGDSEDLMEEFKLCIAHYYGDESKRFLGESKKQVKKQKGKVCEKKKASPSYVSNKSHGLSHWLFLNNDYLCLPPGDFKTKAKVITQEEDKEFKVEGQQFGSNMLKKWLKLSCEYLEEMIKRGGTCDGRIGNTHKIAFQRCVEKIWGDCAADVLDTFHNDNENVGPIILTTLKQKLEELVQYQNHLKLNVWRCGKPR